MLLKGVEVWYVRIGKPVPTYDQDGMEWSLQARTYDPKVAEEWKSLNLSVKVMPSKDGSEPYWFLRLNRRCVNAKGQPVEQPVCVDRSLKPLNPNTIGNGSVANLNLYQYEYEFKKRKGFKALLKGVQILHLVPYEEGDGFEAVPDEYQELPED